GREGACMQFDIEIAGTRAGEYGEAMLRAFRLRRERGNGGFRRLAARGRAGHVELRAASRIVARLRDLEGFALIVEVGLRDLQTTLRAAQLEVIARGFGHHAHLRVAQSRFGRLRIGTRRLNGTADMAEEVDLPRRV